MELHYGINDFKDIDFMFFLPIVLPVMAVGAILVFLALFDLYRHRKTRENALTWMVVILFVNTLGPILYFVIGRRESKRL
ncbi:PLD nuclease N-terminal domain-containing protein [Metabacillus niabensis]|uniref:PLD nuclease N-terminal domain-containing protein n=1 Tax=Metabacillus niabensis TaxID=324854 RepID=UPI001CF9B170|nr:PLD nuclease N-terminal domain-containing protein [Metabacillus niabensis]